MIINQNSTYNSPSNILLIYALFLSYFHKYHRSVIHLSRRIIPSMNGKVVMVHTSSRRQMFTVSGVTSSQCPGAVPV